MTTWTWFRVPTALYDRLAELGRAAVVYLILARHANDNGESWPSQATIAEVAGLSDRCVRKYLAALEKAGLIRGTRRRRDTQVYLLADLSKTGSYVPVKAIQDRNAGSTQDHQERNGTSGQRTQDRNAGSVKTGTLVPTEEEQGRREKRAPSRFTPPTLQEVQVYCSERKNQVDPQRFLDHYESNGWRVGRNAMKDWRAAVRTWERNGYHEGNGKPPKPAEPIRYRDEVTR